MKGRIKINSLNKTFVREGYDSTLCAIESLDLTISPGEFVSVVGASGCGKSTLLRIIAGLEIPTRGEVLVDGEKVMAPGPDRGLVFQDHTLFPWLTVRKNIVFALKTARRFEEGKDRIDALIAAAGLTEFANFFPHQLSGGMRQRAALIRSLAVSPDVLLLDEPLGALDSFTRMTLQDELVRLWKERGNTMVMITHDVDEAIYLSSRIAIMSPQPGRITDIVEVSMAYPRNRGSDAFTKMRVNILKQLHFASDVQQEYNI